jgi:hypothetical protein
VASLNVRLLFALNELLSVLVLHLGGER